MTKTALRRLTGVLFIAGAVLVNIPYTLLIMTFDYPDVLRQPPGEVLTAFHASGSALVFTWLAFAWAGIPLLFAILLLQKVMEREDNAYLWSATAVGVVGAVVQMVGLLRWSFVVPGLAAVYTDPGSTEAARQAAIVVFQAIHQYGGVVLGEHIGQTFTILWMLLVSVAMFSSTLFRPWLAWFGILASCVYALAQTELLATVVPGFPVVPESGLVGSVLWLAWMIALGVVMVVSKKPAHQ